MENRAAGGVVRQLIELNPEAASEEIPPGSGFLLLDIALRHYPLCDETVEVLLAAGPPQSMFKAVRVPEAARAVGRVVAAKPMLAWTMQRRRGRLIRAIDDAALDCRLEMQAGLYFLRR